jgi:glucan phosphoethanolaminetransferase (alkaline phosphatase superfamily)
MICIAGVFMLAYSFLAEKYNIYFFWESSLIGFLTLLLGLIPLLLLIIKSRKQQKKGFKSLVILAGLISFMLLLFLVGLFIFYNSDAYLTSKDYLIHNEILKNELGNINDVSIVLSGEMSSGVKNSNTPTNGTAEFLVIVKGEQKYKKVVISLTKEEDKWSVINYTKPF